MYVFFAKLWIKIRLPQRPPQKFGTETDFLWIFLKNMSLLRVCRGFGREKVRKSNCIFHSGMV